MTLRAIFIGLGPLAFLVPTACSVEIARYGSDTFAGVPPMPPRPVVFGLTASAGPPLLRHAGMAWREVLVISLMLLVAEPRIGLVTLG